MSLNGEGGDLTRLAIVEDSEVGLFQVGHGLTVSIAYYYVNLHKTRLHLDRRLSRHVRAATDADLVRSGLTPHEEGARGKPQQGAEALERKLAEGIIPREG
jgi:hypothetical protein